MKNKKIVYFNLVCLFVASVVLGGIILFLNENQNAKVVFLDVGQGDSFLMMSGNKQMIVDGGESGKVILDRLGRYIPFWDRNIEVLVLTHADKDHIGGLFGILKSYNVETVIVTNYEKDTKLYDAWKKYLKNEGIEKVEAIEGDRIVFSDEIVADIVYPFYSIDKVIGSANDNSVGMKVEIGPNKFLLMGDLSNRQEKELIESGLELDVDILKLGHHGSKNSSSEKFLKYVSPIEVVISSGEGNRYGHPHEETLDRLEKEKIKVVRTDKEGDIVYECKKSERCVRLIQ